MLLQGAMKATPNPVAGYDPMAVLAKRAGRSDVNALASAFRWISHLSISSNPTHGRQEATRGSTVWLCM